MVTQDRFDILSSAVHIAHSGSLSHHARLKSLSQLLSKTFHLESASIYILDSDKHCFIARIASSGPEQVQSCTIPADDLVPHAISQHATLSGAGTFSLPLMDSGRLLGMIYLCPERDVPSPDTHDRLLQDILKLMAGLLRSAGIVEESGRRIRDLSALNDFGFGINRPMKAEAVLAKTLRGVQGNTGSLCTLLRLNPPAGRGKKVYAKCVTALKPHLATLHELEAEYSARVMESGMPLLVTDIVADPDLPASSICVPLKFAGNVTGTITVFGRKGGNGLYRNYDEEDRELLENMMVLVDNALESTLSAQRMEALARENDKKLREIALLYRISNTMLSTINLNKLIHLILTALTAGPNSCFERAMLFLINERTGIMQGMLGVTQETAEGILPAMEEGEDILLSRWEISEEQMTRQSDSPFSRKVRGARLELDRSKNVTARAVLDRRCIHVPDVAREKVVDRDFTDRFDITSFASAPLIARGKVVGVILVDNPFSRKSITRDNLRYLQLFTNQAGMAIENSMLYNRIEDTDRHLQEARDRLLQGEKLAMLGEMAASIAHELKNPLVSIGGFARRLGKKTAQGSAEWKYADIITREVERLEQMLTDILIFSRKKVVSSAKCDVAEIIEEALAILSDQVQKSGVAIGKDIPAERMFVKGDSKQLKQVFLNLIANSLQAMPGGGRLGISLEQGTLDDAPAISVRLADTGGGIQLELLNRIFDPFFTTKDHGTGLGLPIVQAIVSNHGGKLRINNQPGVGVEFTVLLPANH
ncbi:MAG: GAF domain-containing protein [Geobacter sp.]|nr:GAF domain-containing protein [Geobacter sp.]